MTAPYTPPIRRKPTGRSSFYGDPTYDPTADPDGPGGGYASISNAPGSNQPGKAPPPITDAAAQKYGTQSANPSGYQGRNPNAPGATVQQGAAGTGTTLANPHGQGYGYTPPGGWTTAQGQQKQFQTGAYDPNNPNEQYNADGSFDLGVNNGENAANAWQSEQNSATQAQGTAQTRAGQAATAHTAAQTAAGNMPAPYQAPAAWQTPGAMPGAYQRTPYQAPAAWQDPTQGAMPASYQGNGPRNAITSTGDIAGDTSTLAAALKSAQGGAPVQAQSVGGGGAAFTDYARGASNSMLAALKQQLSAQTDTAAGRGRVGSGFYQQDSGTLARGLAGDSENNILSGALQAATLDQQAATGNADRNLSAGEFNAGQGQTAALAGLSTAASTGMQRSALDQSDYSTDQTFGLNKQAQDYGQSADQRNFSRSAYDDDRNFGAQQQQTDFTQGLTLQAQDYGQSADARNFSRSSYDDDRNFGSAQQQTNYGQAADQRNFAQSGYQYEDQAATGAQQYANSRVDNNYNITQQQIAQNQANKGPSIGSVLGGIGGTLLGSALGPIGAGIGGKIGSSLFGGGGGGQQSSQQQPVALGANGQGGWGAGSSSPQFGSSYGENDEEAYDPNAWQTADYNNGYGY